MNFLLGDVSRMDKRQVSYWIKIPSTSNLLGAVTACVPTDVLPGAQLWNDSVLRPDDMEGPYGVSGQ